MLKNWKRIMAPVLFTHEKKIKVMIHWCCLPTWRKQIRQNVIRQWQNTYNWLTTTKSCYNFFTQWFFHSFFFLSFFQPSFYQFKIQSFFPLSLFLYLPYFIFPSHISPFLPLFLHHFFPSFYHLSNIHTFLLINLP